MPENKSASLSFLKLLFISVVISTCLSAIVNLLILNTFYRSLKTLSINTSQDQIQPTELPTIQPTLGELGSSPEDLPVVTKAFSYRSDLAKKSSR